MTTEIAKGNPPTLTLLVMSHRSSHALLAYTVTHYLFFLSLGVTTSGTITSP